MTEKNVRVAVCGELPTACEYLLSRGTVSIDQFCDAVNLQVRDYDLILVYAPQGEGLLNNFVAVRNDEGEIIRSIPMRLLNEPCCHAAQAELGVTVRIILKEKKSKRQEETST